MKKTTLIAALSLACAVGAFGQGQINFNTRAGNPGEASYVFSPIYGVNAAAPATQLRGNSTSNTNQPGPVNYGSAALLTGTGYTAALFGGLSTAVNGDERSPNLALLATAVFRPVGALAGHVIGSAPLVPGVPGDSQARASFQLRAWDNLGGTITSWAAAMANPAIAQGSSALFTVPAALGIPIPPPNLIGLTSFNLVVPEPGVIALGVLGLGALLLRRRK